MIRFAAALEPPVEAKPEPQKTEKPEAEKRDETTLGIDVQSANLLEGPLTKDLQVTFLLRNLEAKNLYYHNDWDIALGKEPGLQIDQPLSKQGPVLTLTIDAFNVSHGPLEGALTFNAGYNTAQRISLAQASVGGKLDLAKWDFKVGKRAESLKLRAYFGAGAEEDFPSLSSARYGGFSWSGGLLIESNPLGGK